VNGRPVIHVGHLPNLVSGPRAPLWWGMVMLLVIESMVFGTLIASYFYLRMGAPEWPPPGISPPDLALPAFNTLVLLASSGCMYYGDSSIKKGNNSGLIWGVAAAVALALVFLILKVVEYAAVPYRWDEHAYASIVWSIVGFHSAHVASVALKGAVVFILAYRRYFTAERHLGVQVNGLYWHFVVLVWLPLFAVLYLAPRMME
jgi:cytochrome c oxidase subunit III